MWTTIAVIAGITVIVLAVAVVFDRWEVANDCVGRKERVGKHA